MADLRLELYAGFAGIIYLDSESEDSNKTIKKLLVGMVP
jgi:hypothetical protein